MTEYTIVPITRGFEVSGPDGKYCIAMKLFSLSAKTFDCRGVQVASMKRSSWWKLNYRIEAENEVYAFSSSAFNDTLAATNAAVKFRSNGSTDLYDANGTRVTELFRNTKPLGSLGLRIHMHAHHQAFILVSCLYYKTVFEAPGHAA